LKVVGNAHHYRTIPQTTVHIRVLNINDNVPALAPMRPRKISEAAQVGTLIATVRATDVDVDTQLEYSINPPNPLFMINRLTGTIHLASPLDYETTQEHRLPIQVTDGENISKSTLVVVVLDENDNAPKFDKDFYDVTVPQNLAIGSAITKMTARDVDSGLAGQVYYNISTTSDRFQMDSQSGVLKLKSRLAFGSVHYVKVQAFDYGLPQMSAAVTLRISVNDSANRVQAKFNKKSYSFSIPENTSANVRIGNIRASIMPDAKFDYRIIEPECARLVRIDHNGDVFLQQQIDREKNQTLKFTVEASSRSSFVNATTIVHIQLLDTNDNVPQFFASTDKIIVNEHMKHGELLVRMSASDRDAGKNGRITYSILSGNEHGMFRLDSASGTIVFEQWNEQTLLLSEPIQKLVVAAQDHGNPSRWNHTTISVSIERQLWSGSAPFFALPSYQASVFENTQVGSVVLKSRAVSRSGIIEPGWEYTLKDNDEAFACNRTTGDIILVKELDFETRNGYQFSLIVKDQSRRSAIVPINVIVLGIDEYPPMFMRNKYTFQIPRTAEIGQRVGAVTATDQDSGIDGVVRYEMEGDALRYLGIDPDSGQIVLTRELSEKMKKNVSFDEFVVIASSGTRQYSRVKVFIEIGDFTSSNGPNAKESLMNAKILTIASLVLLFVLLLTLVVIIIRMRIRVYKQRKPRKQVYSVSRGNVAVMADLHRLSPRFEYEKQRAHVPTPSTSSNNRPSSLSLSRCSDESIRMRQKMFAFALFFTYFHLHFTKA
uniref:Cadherin domain protein n=1 Tax=Anisakis simplex TaxID=6269 RepID=A0A0M3KB95_ANISI